MPSIHFFHNVIFSQRRYHGKPEWIQLVFGLRLVCFNFWMMALRPGASVPVPVGNAPTECYPSSDAVIGFCHGSPRFLNVDSTSPLMNKKTWAGPNQWVAQIGSFWWSMYLGFWNLSSSQTAFPIAGHDVFMPLKKGSLAWDLYLLDQGLIRFPRKEALFDLYL